MSDGNELQSSDAATGNVRRPTVVSRNGGTTSWCDVMMLTEVGNDCTEKCLNNNPQHVKSSVKCELVYYK